MFLFLKENLCKCLVVAVRAQSHNHKSIHIVFVLKEMLEPYCRGE
jgi:hypothetical protein